MTPRDASRVVVDCSPADEHELPEVFVDYEEKPREYNLCAVTTVVDIHTRVSELYSVPHNQIAQQLRLTIEAIKEQQESELNNSSSYGLLSNDPSARDLRAQISRAQSPNGKVRARMPTRPGNDEA